MENDVFVGVRMSRKLASKIERERKKMSRMAGAEVKMSSTVRALLERATSERPKTSRTT